MSFVEVIVQGLMAGLMSVGKLALIVLPLMVIIEWVKQRGWLEQLSQKAEGFTRAFFLPGQAALPTLAGLFIGVIFGSGIILQTAREGGLTRTHLTIICVMIGICHAVLEETVIFLGIGANAAIVMGSRLLVALLFAYVIGFWLHRRMIRQNSSLPMK